MCAKPSAVPIYAKMMSDPQKEVKEEDIISETLVKITLDVKKGQIVEYNLLQAGKIEKKSCALNGFINWKPIYKPFGHPLE